MRLASIGLALALLAAAGPARAGAFELLGFGAEGVAEINARAARADDGTAAFYNPGGLAMGRGLGLSITPTLGLSRLSAQGEVRPLDDPFGVSLAFDVTLPFGGVMRDRLRIGVGAHFASGGALHLLSRQTHQPFFPQYDNRTQRLVLLPALAARITDRLAIGLALNVLGGVAGPVAVLPGASGAPEPRLDLEATTTLAVNAGLRVDPSDHVRLALVVRQRFAVPARITTAAEIGGVPLRVSVDAGEALYDPTTIVIGSSFDLGRSSLELDASYAVWSAWKGPFAAVRATLPGVNLGSELPSTVARDVVSLRAAAEHRIVMGDLGLTLRGGAGFEPGMLTSFQQGRSNLLDGDKLLAGLGASLRISGALGLRALHLGAGANLQGVLPSSQSKRVCLAAPCPPDTVAGPDAGNPGERITNPGYPRLEGGGAFFAFALSVGAEL